MIGDRISRELQLFIMENLLIIKNGKVSYNETNKDSNGGTELTGRGLFSRIDKKDLDGIQLISSRVRELDHDLIKILWLHDTWSDPESQLLKTEQGRNQFHKLVFSSNWQYQSFQSGLGIPYSNHSAVIDTGVEPIPYVEKPKDKIRLIYTSTPHRGLGILVPVFIELAKHNPDIQLDVFSSFGIYGPQWEARNTQFEPLFQLCRDHPQINYHGWADQDTVRAAYQKAHVFAYPCIWPETSCRSLIEAMSAGCLALHPNFAALSDTSAGLTWQYDGDHTDHNLHANKFLNLLQNAINTIRSQDMSLYLQFVKTYADTRFSWDNIIPKWTSLLRGLKEEAKIK